MTNSCLGGPFSCADVKEPLGKLKSWTAGGCSGILPEKLKLGRCSGEFLNMITDLTNAVWEVPQEWVDAILIPIPKKGNLRLCDNWRSIALLNIVGKLISRIFQG